MTDELVSRNPDKYYSKISVKNNASALDEFNRFGEDEQPVRFCEHCKENGLHNVLRSRLNYDGHDKHEWLECNRPRRGCGRIYLKYASKVESNVTDFVDPESNPHDVGHSIVGLQNLRKKSDIEKKRERQLKELNSIEDADERRDRRKIGFVEYDSAD